MSRKRVCIISYSPIARDARVLRQIKYLGAHFDLTVIGYGARPSRFPDIEWVEVEAKSSLLSKLITFPSLVLGRTLAVCPRPAPAYP